ncbi:MAG: glucose-6-phosphate isomerase [Planctomycetota bacterium]|jgi:glucose-6-phosphate isomerase
MLTIDYSNCVAHEATEHAIPIDSLHPAGELATIASRITGELERSRGTGWERWRLLPEDPMRTEHTNAISSLAKRCAGRFDTILVLGIGGSALGLSALQHALTPLHSHTHPPSSDSPRLLVLDNVDPSLVGGALDTIRRTSSWERTLVICISKSGETAETAAQMLLIRQHLISALGDKHPDHFIAITDPEKGTLRSFCDHHAYSTLPVPDGVGGRFSVLSPVGLFPASLIGIDTSALLDGARDMEARCRQPQLQENPAAMLATLLVQLGARGKTNHVLMPYSNRLSMLTDWYCQLWAESLGKRVDLAGNTVHAGFTPIRALGATDQHSQVQLYREGPNDKVLGFLVVDEHEDDLTIPAGNDIASLAYLENKTLATLLNAEQVATAYALNLSERPNFTIQFPRVDAYNIGAFIQLWQVTTAYAGRMLDIDPYNQPAVETAKQATFGLMGKPGFEQHKRDVEQMLGATRHRIT